MGGRETGATRVQVYLTDPKLVSALNREARQCRLPLSQAAGRAIAPQAIAFSYNRPDACRTNPASPRPMFQRGPT